MTITHRLRLTSECATETPSDETLTAVENHLDDAFVALMHRDMSEYTHAALERTGLFESIALEREHHWVDADGYTMLLSTREFTAPKSTQRLAGVIWCGFESGTTARCKMPNLCGTTYTVRGVTKAMHGDMMMFGMHGDQQGMSHRPPEERRYPHPFAPGSSPMSDVMNEFFVSHADDFTAILETYAPTLVKEQRRVIANAKAGRYSISENAPAFAYAISVSYVASPHGDKSEFLPSAILFVCRETVDDWYFQAGPFLIKLPTTPGRARLVVLDSVSVLHGTLYSDVNPDHANLGSVLMMDHDMMYQAAQWNIDHASGVLDHINRTMSAFAPDYYTSPYANNGTVNPELLDRFSLRDVDGKMVQNFGKEGSEQVFVRRLMHMLVPMSDEHVYEFGANIGRNTIHMAKYLMQSGGRVTTFEPSVEICKVLRENVESNGVGSCVTVVEGALSRSPHLFMEEFVAVTEKSLRGVVLDEGEISVTCIDTLTDRPTGLVFDCEGAYAEILRDFPEIMERVRFVFCELDGSKEDSKDLRMYLDNQGLHRVFENATYAIFVAASALKEEIEWVVEEEAPTRTPLKEKVVQEKTPPSRAMRSRHTPKDTPPSQTSSRSTTTPSRPTKTPPSRAQKTPQETSLLERLEEEVASLRVEEEEEVTVEDWATTMLERIASGTLKTYEPQSKIPKSIVSRTGTRAIYTSVDDNLIFAMTPEVWTSLGVPAGDHPLKNKVLGLATRRLKEIVTQAGGKHFPELGVYGVSVQTCPWFAINADKVDAFQQAANVTPQTLDTALNHRSSAEKIDRAVQRRLNEQGMSRCTHCTMPVLDAGDLEFDAKAAAIQEIAQIGRALHRCACGGVH